MDQEKTGDRRAGFPERIKTIARQQGIELDEYPELRELLDSVDLNRKLPDEVYALIAELVLRVYSLKDQWKSKP